MKSASGRVQYSSPIAPKSHLTCAAAAMDVLDSARKRKSAIADQLADQDAAMAQLQAKLEAARVEGERLKARAEEAPEAPAAAAAHADTSVAVVVSETPVVEAAAPSRPRDAAPVPTAETTAPATPPRPPSTYSLSASKT